MRQVQTGVGVAALLQIDQHGAAIGLHDEVAWVRVEGDQATLGASRFAQTSQQPLPLAFNGRQHSGRQRGSPQVAGLRVDLFNQGLQRVGRVQQRCSRRVLGQRHRVQRGECGGQGGQVLREPGRSAFDLLHQQRATRQVI